MAIPFLTYGDTTLQLLTTLAGICDIIVNRIVLSFKIHFSRQKFDFFSHQFDMLRTP